MNSEKTIKSANDFATSYDDYIKNCQWIGTDILFGLMFENIKPNQILLDIGIGTGLSSKLFKQAGLKIFGIDGSSKMISVCQSKGFVDKLKIVNLTMNDTWFDNVLFDIVISHGVFHLIGDLELVFQKVFSGLQNDGYFGFTYERKSDSIDGYRKSSINGLFERANAHSGIKVFRHTEKYITNLLNISGFQLLKQTEFLAFVDSNTNVRTYFNVIVAKKN